MTATAASFPGPLDDIEPEPPEITFTDDEQVVIVGAGLSGLATAHSIVELAAARWRPVPRISIVEAADRVGGKIQTARDERGFLCECGPGGFLDREPMTLQLCRHLKLEPLSASGASRNRYLYVAGALRAVPTSPLRFASSPLLSWPGKLRLAAEVLTRRRPAVARDESVAEFARRHIGDEGFRTLIDAMQSGIFAGDPDRLAVASCFPRVVEIERDHRSLVWGMLQVLRKRRRTRKHRRGDPLPGAGPSGQLTSFVSGLQTLTDRLAEVLAALEGVAIHLGRPVARLTRQGEDYEIVADGASASADVVIAACPAFAAAKIVAGHDPRLATVLREISYAPMAVVCLGFDREQVSHPLGGFGFLAPRDQGVRLLGTLFCSTIFVQRAPADQVLMRVMIGGARDPTVLDQDDQAIVALVCRELQRILGIHGPPAVARVFRHARAIPQYNLGHRGRLARIAACLHRHPGLFVTGNAYRGIGVNDCVRNAWTTAEDVLAYLDDRSGRF